MEKFDKTEFWFSPLEIKTALTAAYPEKVPVGTGMEIKERKGLTWAVFTVSTYEEDL